MDVERYGKDDDSDESDIEMVRMEDLDDDDEGDYEGEGPLLGVDRPRGSRDRIQEPLNHKLLVQKTILETLPTLLFTTIGLLFTGELLDHVSRWNAMQQIDELIILVPMLLNLKGNLEMNLSSRLGTAANMGNLDQKDVRNEALISNMAVLQIQAVAVSFIAACVSFLLGRIVPRPESGTAAVMEARARIPHRPKPPLKPSPESGFLEYLTVAACAMTSAALSSVLLGSFMCFLIVLCRRMSLNPDNIAPPIASCLGDLVTLCILGQVSALVVPLLATPVPVLLVGLLVAAAIGLFVFLHRRQNEHRALLKEGWSPLFLAMAVESGTGLVLDAFVSRYSGFALLAVVISGLPGAVGSIFVARLSTALHTKFTVGERLPSGSLTSPREQTENRINFLTLFIVTIPVEVVFLIVLNALGWLKLPLSFVGTAVLFFCGAVLLSLLIAQYLTQFLWKRKYDPDTYALPIQSSVVDLIGQLLLVLCFEFVSLFGVKVKAVA